MPTNEHEAVIRNQLERIRRFQAAGKYLRVSEDGRELQEFDPAAARGAHLLIDPYSQYVEVWSDDRDGELLLAVIGVPDGHEDRPRPVRLGLGGGRYVKACFRRSASYRLAAEGADEPVAQATGALRDEEVSRVEKGDPLWELELSYREGWLAQATSHLPAWLFEGFMEPVGRRLATAAAMLMLVVVLAGATYGIAQYSDLLARYDLLAKQLFLDEPFTVQFAAVGRRSLELDVSLHPEIVREVWVDWGDPRTPEEVRIYPSAEEHETAIVRLRARHEYGGGGAHGFRTYASARIVPTTLPEVVPESLSEDRRNPTRSLWVLPVGLVLDPPPEVLRFVLPPNGAVTAGRAEIKLDARGLTAPIHLLARDPAGPKTYQPMAMLEPPSLGRTKSIRTDLDLSSTGEGASVELLAVSASALPRGPQGLVHPSALPSTSPRASITLRRAARILEPKLGAAVGPVGVVRIATFLPGHHAVVLIRPHREGSYWVQSAPLLTVGRELSVPVHYGGRDTYDIYVGITDDGTLFRVGDQLENLPLEDTAGAPIFWVGPVVVHATAPSNAE